MHYLDAIGNERRFQLLLDAVKDYAIYLLDENGFVRSWNTGAERFKGYKAGEIIGQHFSRFYTEEDRASGVPDQALRTAVREGKFEAEGWRVRKDGTRFWTSVLIDPVYSETGALVGFAKVTRDITHKREAEQALYESEQRFRLLVQGVKDCAIFMLDPDGHITNWNPGATAIKGYSESEIVGQHFSVLYTAEDRAAGEPARSLQIALTEGKYESEGWRVRKDGTRFWASVLIDPIRDTTGKLIGFAKVTRDVTDRRKAQEEAEKAKEALSQAQKMEAIGRLTGGVAHDFNNILTVIRGSAEVLRNPKISEERRTRYVDAIATTADRAALLTGQLLAFARRQPLKPERFDVAARIEGMRHIISTTVGSHVQVMVDLAEHREIIEADPSQFETAILNLVINARDAMPSGGTLRLDVRAASGVPAVRGHAAAPGDFVAISVEDSGTGIEPGALTRIFEPFFTTKDVSKGTGLGLSQVHGFAKQSGGDIGVVSTVGRGSAFTLYLPRIEAQVEEGPVETVESVVPRLEAKTILLVEDNKTVGEFALDLLTEMGQAVTWVTHVAAALEILNERHAEFDLVFSDVVMPGASGIDLGREIRLRWPDLPVVLTSGYSHVLAEDGNHGFTLIQKPYSMKDLISLVGGSDGSGPQSRAA